MSMSVQLRGLRPQYAGHRGPRASCAGAGGADRATLRMLTEVPRFHARARELSCSAATTTISPGPVPGRGTVSRRTSAPISRAAGRGGVVVPPGHRAEYPPRYLFTFLVTTDAVDYRIASWYTVAGGSRSYVERIASQIPAVRTSRHRSWPCTASRTARGPRRHGEFTAFDAVVIATHADQALRLLARADAGRAAGCSARSGTRRNPALLHTDTGCCRPRGRGLPGTTSSAPAARAPPASRPLPRPGSATT